MSWREGGGGKERGRGREGRRKGGEGGREGKEEGRGRRKGGEGGREGKEEKRYRGRREERKGSLNDCNHFSAKQTDILT